MKIHTMKKYIQRSCLVVGLLLSMLLAGCQLSGSSTGPSITVLNAQGTPIANGTSGPTATPAPPPNLLHNGDFVLDWSDGWVRDTGDVIRGQNITEIIASAAGSSGKAVRLVHDGPSYLSLVQVIDLATLDLNVNAQVNPMAIASCRGILAVCMGVSGIRFIFLDQKGQYVGAINYMYPGNADQYSLTSDATHRGILLQPDWQTIRFNIRQEIVNTLPEIDLNTIAKLQVILIAGSIGSCDPSQCYAELQATGLSIEPVLPLPTSTP